MNSDPSSSYEDMPFMNQFSTSGCYSKWRLTEVGIRELPQLPVSFLPCSLDSVTHQFVRQVLYLMPHGEVVHGATSLVEEKVRGPQGI